MRRLPAAVSERFASERYPALQGYGPDAAGNHGGYPPAVATCPVPSAAGFVLQHYSQLFRGTAFRQQAADALQGASGLIITVVTDLPQIEWSLKTESLTAVYQFAPAFVELCGLAALFFCQRPDDAVQRTAAAQFFKAVSSVTSGSAVGLPPYISTVWSPSSQCCPVSPGAMASASSGSPVTSSRRTLRRQNGP